MWELFKMGFHAGMVTLGWLSCMALALLAMMFLAALWDFIAGKVSGERE